MGLRSRFAVGTFKKEASRAFKLLLLFNNIVAMYYFAAAKLKIVDP